MSYVEAGCGAVWDIGAENDGVDRGWRARPQTELGVGGGGLESEACRCFPLVFNKHPLSI